LHEERASNLDISEPEKGWPSPALGNAQGLRAQRLSSSPERADYKPVVESRMYRSVYSTLRLRCGDPRHLVAEHEASEDIRE